MKSFLGLVFTIALLATPALHAEIYKHIDERGNIIFTDKPTGVAKAIDIRAPNSLPAPIKPSVPANKENLKKEKPVYTITIVSPANGAIIPLGPGNFSVNVSVSPALSIGHRLQLLLDGQVHGSAQQSTHFALSNIYRGSHQIAVRIVDSKNKTVKQSESIVVHVFRPKKRR